MYTFPIIKLILISYTIQTYFYVVRSVELTTINTLIILFILRGYSRNEDITTKKH